MASPQSGSYLNSSPGLQVRAVKISFSQLVFATVRDGRGHMHAHPRNTSRGFGSCWCTNRQTLGPEWTPSSFGRSLRSPNKTPFAPVGGNTKAAVDLAHCSGLSTYHRVHFCKKISTRIEGLGRPDAGLALSTTSIDLPSITRVVLETVSNQSSIGVPVVQSDDLRSECQVLLLGV